MPRWRAAEPIDLQRRRPRRPEHPTVPAEPGLVVTHRGTGEQGRVVRFGGGLVALRDDSGRNRTYHVVTGGFVVDGRVVSLGPPRPAEAPSTRTTASGSIADVRPTVARIARGSRMLVEGVHDAELVERVWGDDLRELGVVVGILDGADDLRAVVDEIDPGPDRRLGILLDHLVDGSKESRIAAAVTGPHVLVTGHPYVDVWQAVRPSVLGIRAWPVIPPGQPWKEGVLAALGVRDTPAAFWRQVLGRVTSYADLEPGLVGAVEELIDFVAPPPDP
ncbi:MAG: DUF3097 family protein [Actinomycetota bacterium]